MLRRVSPPFLHLRLLAGWVLAFGLLALAGDGFAQQRQETVLQLGGVQSDGEFIRIQYTVPYEGYVELRLFGPNDVFMGRKHYVVNVGEHEALIHRGRLVAGTQYTFTFIYKGREYPGSFFNN